MTSIFDMTYADTMGELPLDPDHRWLAGIRVADEIPQGSPLLTAPLARGFAVAAYHSHQRIYASVLAQSSQGRVAACGRAITIAPGSTPIEARQQVKAAHVEAASHLRMNPGACSIGVLTHFWRYGLDVPGQRCGTADLLSQFGLDHGRCDAASRALTRVWRNAKSLPQLPILLAASGATAQIRSVPSEVLDCLEGACASQSHSRSSQAPSGYMRETRIDLRALQGTEWLDGLVEGEGSNPLLRAIAAVFSHHAAGPFEVHFRGRSGRGETLRLSVDTHQPHGHFVHGTAAPTASAVRGARP